MLIIALALAIIGLAALVFAVVTSNALVAWVCIGASVLGVLLLIIDALRERRRGGARPAEPSAKAEPAADTEDTAGDTAEVSAASDVADTADENLDDSAGADEPAVEPAESAAAETDAAETDPAGPDAAESQTETDDESADQPAADTAVGEDHNTG